MIAVKICFFFMNRIDQIRYIPGPVGVRSRNPDNRLIKSKLGWTPCQSLRKGLEITYQWIEQQVAKNS